MRALKKLSNQIYLPITLFKPKWKKEFHKRDLSISTQFCAIVLFLSYLSESWQPQFPVLQHGLEQPRRMHPCQHTFLYEACSWGIPIAFLPLSMEGLHTQRKYFVLAHYWLKIVSEIPEVKVQIRLDSLSEYRWRGNVSALGECYRNSWDFFDGQMAWQLGKFIKEEAQIRRKRYSSSASVFSATRGKKNTETKQNFPYSMAVSMLLSAQDNY